MLQEATSTEARDLKVTRIQHHNKNKAQMLLSNSLASQTLTLPSVLQR